MCPATPSEEELAGFQPRRSARTHVGEETASLMPDGRYAVEVRIHNVSSAGFMAECAQPVMIGSHVSLEVPGIGTVKAQVRWQLGTKMGGMFLDPISLARCEWTAVKAEAA
jgi:hypothetical protein